MFTLKDLKPNDWCVQADGDVMRTVRLNGLLVLVGKGQYCDLNGFHDDLTYQDIPRLSIDRVYRPRVFHQLLRTNYKDGELMFERKDS